MESEWKVGAVLHPKTLRKIGYTVFRYLYIRDGNPIKSREKTHDIYDVKGDAQYIADMLNLGANIWRHCDNQRRRLLEDAGMLQKINKTKSSIALEQSAVYAEIMNFISSMKI